MVKYRNIILLLVIPLFFGCNTNKKKYLFEYVDSSRSKIKFSNNIIENDSINPSDCLNCFNGGGVGIGNSLHAGMVIVADGTNEREKRLRKVLTVDPGVGIARHVDAGYEIAVNTARQKSVKIPE